ncbi:hypothetical protein ANME2D_01539 [Candidatus Methanoperedens nitroreducens]|uniref:Uncharacterized protein n=1 Tax=Candidatus Methanoperedens nitratireducens TaxID=1392998 RepID=A0A062UYX7_9EURY|nr:hypothetical protein [Candidatus Methanoperedens nitroreducens]KCZ72136.1 hypothetical protein ANME2D_01539 [Candidatus Methanoperedens nitroreducens]MDJ1421887.1 hypothetical protein [Candidatus Methanoperedens sp.]
MNTGMELLDSVSYLLFALILYILSILSRRLGEVMGMKRYYYLYYAGISFVLSGSIVRALSLAEFEYSYLLGYALFAAGLTLSLIATVKYWGWLIREYK